MYSFQFRLPSSPHSSAGATFCSPGPRHFSCLRTNVYPSGQPPGVSFQSGSAFHTTAATHPIGRAQTTLPPAQTHCTHVRAHIRDGSDDLPEPSYLPVLRCACSGLECLASRILALEGICAVPEWDTVCSAPKTERDRICIQASPSIGTC
ncbi:hypothetical protein PsYK624_153250 [Phanerochaete sordida]|uniref:Uncharacterized protein n=1 Tax=Phanerochaete sordida TaxID=48140 RepID=A0A9P3GQ77_9APHY|nr:hypothetical protein PsYK624_153250 [Phanerochaete sordida]